GRTEAADGDPLAPQIVRRVDSISNHKAMLDPVDRYRNDFDVEDAGYAHVQKNGHVRVRGLNFTSHHGLSHQTAAGEIYRLYIESMFLPNFFLLRDTAKIVGSNAEPAITHPERLGHCPLARKMTWAVTMAKKRSPLVLH